MAGSIPSQLSYGVYIPSTIIINPRTIDQAGIAQALVFITKEFNKISLAMNEKTTGVYNTMEYIDGNTWFPTIMSGPSSSYIYRQEYRVVINFGTLPNTASKTVAHNLDTTNWILTHAYGAATDPGTSYIPIPYASTTLANNIELSVDGTNVTITTGIDRTGYTTCYVVLEYLKN